MPGFQTSTFEDIELAEKGSDPSRTSTMDPEIGRHSGDVTFESLIAKDHTHQIKLRTMSWQKAAWLIAGEQVCLAISGQGWALAELGWIPGLAIMLLCDIMFYFTSMTLWKYMMRHPEIKDMTDFAYFAFGKSLIAYHLTAFMMLCNNIVLIGFHVLTGSKILNTLSNHSMCTREFQLITMIMGIILSLPRKLNHVSVMSMFSAANMALALILLILFAGIEIHPNTAGADGYPHKGEPHTVAIQHTTFQKATNAILNITFLWVPQILFPTFIAEMKQPEDFPKSIRVLTGISSVLFVVPPAIVYHFQGQYASAPGFVALGESIHRKVSFVFALVPTLVIAVIYANVAAKYIYAHVMRGSYHAHSNTIIGWGAWTAVIVVVWLLGWMFGEVVPSMATFAGILSAAFNSFYGFIYLAVAYWQLNKRNLFGGFGRTVNTVFNVFIFAVGLFILGPGMYAAIAQIKEEYAKVNGKWPMGCDDNQY